MDTPFLFFFFISGPEIFKKLKINELTDVCQECVVFVVVVCCCCCCLLFLFTIGFLISLHHQLSWDASSLLHTYILFFFFSFFFFFSKDCHVNPLPKIIFYFFKDRKVIHFGLLSVDKYKFLLKIIHMTYKLKLEICWIKERNGMLCSMALSLFSSLFSFSLDTPTHTQAFFFCWLYDSLSSCFVFSQYFSSLIPLSSPLLLLLFPLLLFPLLLFSSPSSLLT